MSNLWNVSTWYQLYQSILHNISVIKESLISRITTTAVSTERKSKIYLLYRHLLVCLLVFRFFSYEQYFLTQLSRDDFTRGVVELPSWFYSLKFSSRSRFYISTFPFNITFEFLLASYFAYAQFVVCPFVRLWLFLSTVTSNDRS